MNQLVVDLTHFEKLEIDLGKYVYLQAIAEGIDPLPRLDSDKILELERDMYVKILDEDLQNVVLRQKAIDLFNLDQRTNSVSFEEFWEEYHTITGIPKTDRAPAENHWKKLRKREKKLAVERVRNYYDNLNDKRFCKKARTYLADKNFYDEYDTSQEGTSSHFVTNV